MTRYLYVIEIQKPTGAYRFIKALDCPLVVDKIQIDKNNRFAQKLFNDRIENYSYLDTLEVDIWPDLLEEYESLVKQMKISLQYTKDNYVYLIEKEGQFAGDPIYHRNPTLPDYEEKKPIPFYPEKKQEECDPARNVDQKDSDFLSEKYYRIFTERVKSLLYLYGGRHSIPYIVFEAFILTYGEFKKLELEKEKWPKCAQRYQILETEANWIDANRMSDFVLLEEVIIPAKETYDYYIKPTMCGLVVSTGNGVFFSLKQRKEIAQLYWNFINAADKWSKER